jgi:hypothetical protein
MKQVVRRTAPRPSHLPHYIERAALQKMSPIYGLPLAKLHPAGERTVARMLAKGWIERGLDGTTGAVYRITTAGNAARTTRP